MEEQGLIKPRPRMKSRRNRPKSLHREEFNSLSKGFTTRKNLDPPRRSPAVCLDRANHCRYRNYTTRKEFLRRN